MKKKLLLFIPIGYLLLLSSCKKSDGNSTCPLSTTTIAGAYVMTSYTSQATSSSTVVDLFSSKQACVKDDVITMKADGTYAWSEGATACASAHLPGPGTWSLTGSTIKIDGSPGAASFDCQTLTIKHTGTTDIETTTLVRQ
ncbi:MAG: hypothetical protein JWQ09_5979 [Segetibacter sp.]|nr:hypothetical protein [Segetibacter sp.]